jgi:hypothetical protein
MNYESQIWISLFSDLTGLNPSPAMHPYPMGFKREIQIQ